MSVSRKFVWTARVSQVRQKYLPTTYHSPDRKYYQPLFLICPVISRDSLKYLSKEKRLNQQRLARLYIHVIGWHFWPALLCLDSGPATSFHRVKLFQLIDDAHTQPPNHRISTSPLLQPTELNLRCQPDTRMLNSMLATLCALEPPFIWSSCFLRSSNSLDGVGVASLFITYREKPRHFLIRS